MCRVKGNTQKIIRFRSYQKYIPDSLAYQIEEELKESNLSFAVELVNWKRMKSIFQELVKQNLIKIN